MGRVSNPTGQQKETVVGMVLAGLGMQVGRRIGGVMGRSSVYRVVDNTGG